MRIVKNFLWNSSYQIFILIVPLITIPYVSRVLGTTGIGINAFTNSITQYFVLIGSMGLSLYGNREVAYVRDDKKKLSALFWELTILRAVLTFFAALLYTGFILISKEYQVYYWIQMITLIASLVDISWFFQGLENFKVSVLRNFFVKVVSLIFIFTMVKHHSDVGLYIFIIAASTFVGNLTLWPYLRREIVGIHIPDLHIARHIGPMIRLFIPQIAMQLYLQVNKTMLKYLVDVEASGFYDNADKIVKMILALVTSTGTVMLPYVANSFAQGLKEKVQRALNMSLQITLAMAFPAAAGVAAVAPEFVTLYFGPSFNAVAPLMMIESIIIVWIGISSVVGNQYLLPTNQLNAYTNSIVLGSVVNIILNFPLIELFGTPGAMWATMIAEFLVAGSQLWAIRHQVVFHDLFSETWKYLVSALVMLGGVRLTMVAASAYSLTLRLVAGIGVGVVTYVAILLLLRPHNLFSYAKILKGTRRI